MPKWNRLSTRVKAGIIAWIPVVVLLSVWHLWTQCVPADRFYLGSPLGVWQRGWDLVRDGSLPRAFGITFVEVTGGFVLGALSGSVIGLLLWLSVPLQRAAQYHLAVLGSVPLFALGPIFIFWLGTGLVSKVVLSFLASFIISASQASAGTAEVSRSLLQLGTVYGLSRRQILWQIVAPAAFVWVLAGLRVSGGMAILGALVGEFIASRDGLGHLIVVGESLYNVDQIWVGIFALGVMGLGLLGIITPIEKSAKVWKMGHQSEL
jgi:NitT/TauT family transport system permease protein